MAVGTYDGTELPVAVRNNTRGTLVEVAVRAAARGSDGALLAAGGTLGAGLTPHVVEPGRIAFGYVYFGGVRLSAEATFDLTPRGRTPGHEEYTERDFTILSAAYIDHRVVGEVRNDDQGIPGPVAPGDAVPFQVELPVAVDCTNLLVAAEGYNYP